MKKFGLLTFLVVVCLLCTTAAKSSVFINMDLSGIISFSHPDLQQDKDTRAKPVYTCPMHPEIIQDKPGKCPKCGMNLTAKEVAAKSVYTCPMHPEVVQDKAGKCPKCGMDLTLKEAKKDVYTCPMHPEVVQEKAGGKCPKCGMNLVLKKS